MATATLSRPAADGLPISDELRAELAEARSVLDTIRQSENRCKVSITDPSQDAGLGRLVELNLSWGAAMDTKYAGCTVAEYFAAELRMLVGVLSEAARALSGDNPGVGLYDMTPSDFEVGCNESEYVTFKVQNADDADDARRQVYELLAALRICGVAAEEVVE